MSSGYSSDDKRRHRRYGENESYSRHIHERAGRDESDGHRKRRRSRSRSKSPLRSLSPSTGGRVRVKKEHRTLSRSPRPKDVDRRQRHHHSDSRRRVKQEALGNRVKEEERELTDSPEAPKRPTPEKKTRWEQEVPPAASSSGRSRWEQSPGDRSKPKPAAAKQDKEKPSMALSGALTAETNTYNGVVIKYSEPKEAKRPKTRWRLYPFKGETALPVLHIHRQSAYLIGKDRKIADMAVDHPSCSKQHAVLQFRLMPYTKPDGGKGQRVRPYIIDLESTNGTYLNHNRIDSRRYYELKERDVLKFGFSTREYVVLTDQADTSAVAGSSDDQESDQESDQELS